MKINKTNKTSSKLTLPRQRERNSAFTLIELLVVIAIIAILAAFAVPALTSALKKGQMTGTMNNARQLYLAAFQQSNDGAANGDTAYSWPGDQPAITTLQQYCEQLLQHGYLKGGDVQKILAAPGASVSVVVNNGVTPPTITTFTGTPGLKVYRVTNQDASNVLFAVSGNYTYNTDLASTGIPYGTNGFIAMRKGGDAATLRQFQATNGEVTPDSNFLSTVGALTGIADGTVGAETAAMILTPP
jgi:prepilin-type N-terminal cleavage/methylation domain-containing protein